jgi:hypothetical protein
MEREFEWKTWTVLNDDIHIETAFIATIYKNNGGFRLLATSSEGLIYSDTEGATWQKPTGTYTSPHRVVGRRLFVMDDGKTVYYLTGGWQNSPWGYCAALFKSENRGLAFTKVWSNTVIDYDFIGKNVDLWKSNNSNDLYLVDNKTQNLYKITNTIATGNPTISAPQSYSADGVLAGNVYLTGRYNTTSMTDDLYIADATGKHKIFKTTFGNPWVLKGSSSGGLYNKSFLADPDNANLYLGSMQMLTSKDDGGTWTEQYTEWWESYKIGRTGHEDKMHVDIMDMRYFKKSDGTPFILTTNHGGIYVSYDHMVTTSNLSKSNLNVVTLYDQTTASDGYLFLSAQDKGSFRFQANSTTNFTPLVTNNFSTGDGMGVVFYNSDQSIFYMSPTGLTAFPDRNAATTTEQNGLPRGFSKGFEIPGNNILYWERALKPTPDFADSKCLIGGGNLNGGDGSHLIFVDLNNTTKVFNNTQTTYDFRENSRVGQGVISAIGTSATDLNRLYIATNDGIFFSSTDYGVNWTKQTSIMPSTFRPWDIVSANSDANNVFVCGTGWSNPGVYHSTDGGVSFTAMNTGLPNATVFEMAMAPSDQFLFAATSEGPYVYAFANNSWYPLLGTTTPLAVDFNSVQIVQNGSPNIRAAATNPIVRFGTYGRGVWDLEITAMPLPVNLISFTGKSNTYGNVLDWKVSNEVNFSHFDVERSADGQKFAKIGNIASNKSESYSFVDTEAKSLIYAPIYYYRLKMVDRNGTFDYSKIIAINNIELVSTVGQVFPNPSFGKSSINILVNDSGIWTLKTFNAQGQLIYSQSQYLTKGKNTVEVSKLANGMNYIQITNGVLIEVRKVLNK